MPTERAPSSDRVAAPGRRGRLLPVPAGDIRSSRPYLLSGGPLRSLARRTLSVALLVFLDLSALCMGLYGALVVRELYLGHHPVLWGLLWQAEADWLPFLTLITVLAFWQAGLYAERERRAGMGRILSSLLVVALLTLAFGLGTGHHFSTFGLIPTTLLLTVALISVFRASYESLTRTVLRLAGVRRRAVLVGEGEHLARLRRALGEGRGGIDYDFLGVVGRSVDGVRLPLLGDVAALPRILAEHDVDELIVADTERDEDELLRVVEQAHRVGVKVRVAPRATQLLTDRSEYVPGQGVPLFELRPPVLAGADWVLKRGFDLVVSVLVLAAGLPLWLLVAALIKLGSRGPVLYRDRRVGVNELEFAMLKFRTMYVDAAERQAQLEARNEADGPLFKMRRDPRVTTVGRALRRFSIDEIPQLLNVLRGEMSLVGPRPLPLRDHARLEDWHRKRYLVLPGMSGLWQISGRSSLSFDDLVRLDFYYLDNWSIWLDISIIAKTLPAVVTGHGAY